MKIFITGATGYIGGAVAHALRAAGHEVTALVRAGRDASELRAAGIAVVEGDLANILDHLGEIETHDTFVHAAQSQTPDKVELDENAVEAFTRFRHGGRYFLYTSGVWVLALPSHAELLDSDFRVSFMFELAGPSYMKED